MAAVLDIIPVKTLSSFKKKEIRLRRGRITSHLFVEYANIPKAGEFCESRQQYPKGKHDQDHTPHKHTHTRMAYRMEDLQGGRNAITEIAGRDRHKFFSRPIAPTIDGGTQTAGGLPLAYRPTIQRLIPNQSHHLATLPDNVGTSPRNNLSLTNKSNMASKNYGASTTAKARSIAAAAAAANRDASVEGIIDASNGTREIACQTMYRENECQTDPYTPDYVVEEGKQPEVLAIMELRYGEGLPAGLGEVEMIDRVKRRRLIEANLPQGTDDDSTKARLGALEQLEKLEWEEREDHIKKLQETRLQQMERALAKREANREEQSRKRVEALKDMKLAEVDKKLSVIQQRRLGTTRKLTAMHSNPTCERTTRDIITAHVLYGPRSKPVASSALIEKSRNDNYDVRPTLLAFSEGVQELERVAAPRIETVKMAKLAPPENSAINQLPTNYQKRKALETISGLEHANKLIEESHQEKTKVASIQDLYRATPRLQRPDTPVLHLQGDDEEEREEAMLLLQRLLRGRGVQNDFYEGKERCKGLIEELQSASNAKDANKVWEPEQKRDAFRERQDLLVQSVVDGVEGDVVFGTLDYLFKELRRQQAMAKVNALRVHAEAERKSREDAETEKRRQEDIAAALHEQQYAAVLRSVDNTVDSYLSQLFARTIERSAESQALREEWSRLQSQPAPRDPTDQISQEMLVSDLLASYVIPEACRAVLSDDKRTAQALSNATLDTARELAKAV